jgi:membrane protease subunit HflK
VSRFTQILKEYKKAPEITRKRIYLETMESVMSATNTVMVDVKDGNNLMYLPLDKLAAKSAAVAGNNASQFNAPSSTVTPSRSINHARTSSRGRTVRGR